jgi:surfactin synthase thioesterase subunit
MDRGRGGPDTASVSRLPNTARTASGGDRTRSAPNDAERWFHRHRPNQDAPVQWVCLPHAGGSASAYTALAARLTPHVDPIVVQYPGRFERRREPLVTDLRDLAHAVADALVRGLDARPVVLFGYSMGATVAYEVARRLEREQGGVLRGLVAAARRAPSRVRMARVHQADDELLLAELERLGGANTALLADEQLRALFLPVIRADYQAAETYRWRPEEPLRCPIVVLVGSDDPMTPIADAAAWGLHTSGTTSLTVFPGGHFFLDPHLAAITDLIINQVTGQGRRPGPAA